MDAQGTSFATPTAVAAQPQEWYSRAILLKVRLGAGLVAAEGVWRA